MMSWSIRGRVRWKEWRDGGVGGKELWNSRMSGESPGDGRPIKEDHGHLTNENAVA